MKIFESFLKKNELDLTIKEYLDKINDLVKMEGRFFKCYLPLHQGTYVYGNITLDEKTGILHGESYFIRKLDSQTTIKYKPLWKKVEDIKPFNFEEITEKCFKAISAHCKAVFEVASKVNEIVSKEKYNLFTNNNEKISVDINFNWKTSFNSNDYSENTKISDVFKEINKKETQKLLNIEENYLNKWFVNTEGVHRFEEITINHDAEITSLLTGLKYFSLRDNAVLGREILSNVIFMDEDDGYNLDELKSKANEIFHKIFLALAGSDLEFKINEYRNKKTEEHEL